MFTFELLLLSWAGMAFAGSQYGSGTKLAPPLLTSQVSSSATKCWCQARKPLPWIMRDMSMPAALCSATGLFFGLLMNWLSSVRNFASCALLNVETSLRCAIVCSPLRFCWFAVLSLKKHCDSHGVMGIHGGCDGMALLSTMNSM